VVILGEKGTERRRVRILSEDPLGRRVNYPGVFLAYAIIGKGRRLWICWGKIRHWET
jgi:hypothetical protein